MKISFREGAGFALVGTSGEDRQIQAFDIIDLDAPAGAVRIKTVAANEFFKGANEQGGFFKPGGFLVVRKLEGIIPTESFGVDAVHLEGGTKVSNFEGRGNPFFYGRA